MENFKQQLDDELGAKRFDAAMQARVTTYIEQAPTPPRKDLRYIFTMIGAIALVALFLLVSLNPSYTQPQVSATINDPIKSFYANIAEDNGEFKVVTSDFDLNTSHIRNAKKIAELQMLLTDVTAVKNIPKSAYHDVNLIVAYDNGDRRALQFYSDDTMHYWVYDIATKTTYKGAYEDEYKSIYDIVTINSSAFFIFLLCMWAIGWLLPRVTKRIYKRLGVEKRPLKYVSERHRIVSIGSFIFAFIGYAAAFFIAPHSYLYILALIYIPFIVDFYYEYRYGRAYRQYIESAFKIVLISVVLIGFIYGKTYF